MSMSGAPCTTSTARPKLAWCLPTITDYATTCRPALQDLQCRDFDWRSSTTQARRFHEGLRECWPSIAPTRRCSSSAHRVLVWPEMACEGELIDIDMQGDLSQWN